MRALVFALLAFVVTTPAFALSADQKTAAKFGLQGKWAFDCRKAPSAINHQASFSNTNDGWLRYVLDGAIYAIATMEDQGSRMRFFSYRKSDGMAATMIFEFSGRGRYRLFHVEQEDGTYPVRDGKYASNGAPTVWMNRCG